MNALVVPRRNAFFASNYRGDGPNVCTISYARAWWSLLIIGILLVGSISFAIGGSLLATLTIVVWEIIFLSVTFNSHLRSNQ